MKSGVLPLDSFVELCRRPLTTIFLFTLRSGKKLVINDHIRINSCFLSDTDSLHGLVQTRDELNKQRVLLEDKLKAGELLDPSEEGRY